MEFGVVKLDKDLSLKDYAWNSNVGSPLSWAMGFKISFIMMVII
jgi:hypothetical protein